MPHLHRQASSGTHPFRKSLFWQENLTFSTKFSGIGAPEAAIQDWKAAVAEYNNPDGPQFRVSCSSALDNNADCRAVLQHVLQPHPDAHLFNDLVECLDPKVMLEVMESESTTIRPCSKWKKLIMSAPIRKILPCVRHKFRGVG